jgi:hypothetical protein
MEVLLSIPVRRKGPNTIHSRPLHHSANKNKIDFKKQNKN